MKQFILSALMGFSCIAFAYSHRDIPNLRAVNESVYRGGRPTELGMVYLRSLGVKTDINLQGGDIDFDDPALVAFMKWWEPGETAENIAKEKQYMEEVLRIKFVSAPLSSMISVTAEEDARIDQILELMHDKSAQPVFIHCERGQDRTGLVIALYRVKYEDVSIPDAYQEWGDLGHNGIGRIFTGKLDAYFYKKAAQITEAKKFANAK